MSELAKAKQVLVSAAGSLPADTDLQTVVESLLASRGVEEAPDDGEMYARKEEDWVALGSASSVDVGTGSDEVPTNSSLGSAAYVDTGTNPGQVPKNSDLGTSATKDVATTAQAESGSGTQIPDVSGMSAYVSQAGLLANAVSEPSAFDRAKRSRNISISDFDASGYLSIGLYSAISVINGLFLRATFDTSGPRIFASVFNASGEQTKVECRTTRNTTVDSNGFIKQASPIVNLFSDRVEPNDSLEVANAEFEHVDVGHYIVRNVPLLSRDGWYIETPKDRNNNIYFTIDYDESVEGELTIRTYEPDYSTGRATNGNPIDILEGRFVSLRFMEIPELYPQPTEEEVLENEETIISDAGDSGADSL